MELGSLIKAIQSLEKVIIRYRGDVTDDVVRDSVIQRFGYTYAFTIKLIQQYLSINIPILEAALSFNNIIRQADKMGLLKHELRSGMSIGK